MYGNLIGLGADGATAIRNDNDGIHLNSGATGAIIGTSAVADRNIISSNGTTGSFHGIVVADSAASITNNYVGTDITGLIDRGNTGHGFRVFSANATLRGNVIAGNGSDGVNGSGAGLGMYGNLVGLGADGSTVIRNDVDGIDLSSAATGAIIGTAALADRNIIAGNSALGIRLAGATGAITNNYVGTDSTGLIDKGNAGHGLSITAADATLRGNVISGNGLDGINITGTGVGIHGNTIGLGSDGTTLIRNENDGIELTSTATGAIIGTAALADRNIVSGNGSNNTFHGIKVAGATTTLTNNYLGTDSTGLIDKGNAGHGLSITAADATLRGNVISGNGLDGINITGTGVGIHGNTIGLGSDGSTLIRNDGDGIELSSTATGAIIGTAALADRNIVSGNGSNNTFHGITLDGATATITGNYVGTDSTGLLDRGNAGSGVSITGNGMSAILRGNVISGNGRNGIASVAAALGVYGNLIGLGSDGTTAMGNDSEGIALDNGSNGSIDAIIGTTTTGDQNTIAYNGGKAGIAIGAINAAVSGNTIRNNAKGGVVVTSGNIGNRIQQNSIYGNPAIAIGIGWSGPVSNDVLDADGGPNNQQNFPSIGPVRPGDANLTGSLSSAANTTYRLDFYRNPGCTSFGWGDAKEWIGSISTTTNGSGLAAFTFTLPSGAVLGEAYTATATDPTNNTSGISYCAVVETDPQADATTIARNAGSPTPNNGPTVDFDLTFDEPVSDLSAADITVNQTGTLTGSTVTSFAYPMGKALSLDRTVSFSRPSGNIDLSNRSFTIEFWSNRDTVTSGQNDYPIAYRFSSTANNFLHIGWESGYQFKFSFFGNSLDTATEWALSNEWDHWACTFDNGTLARRIYRNGVLLASDTAPAALQNPGTFYIGVNPLGSFAGKLDEVRIWGVARTQAEIQSAMHTPATGAEANLLALYQFETFDDLGVNADGADDLADTAGAGSYPLDQTAGAATVVGSTVYSTTITATVAVGAGDGTLSLSTAGIGTGHDSNYFALTAPGAASQTFAIDQTALTVAITAVTPDPRPAGVSDITIVFDTAVSGFTLSNLALTKDLSPVALSGASLASSDGGITWTLSGLAGLNAADGAYELSLSTTGIVDGASNPLASGATESWTVLASTAVRDWMFLQD